MYIRLNMKTLERMTLPLLIVSFFSAYYASGIPRFSEILTGIYAILGIVFWALEKNCTRNDFACFACAIFMMLYSNNTEGIRYFLLLCSMFTWSKFKYNNVYGCVKILVIGGVLSSLVQVSGGKTRIEGYMSGSPPQFACVLLVCLIYFLAYLFNEKYKKTDIMYPIICVVLIFMTGTRSVLGAAIGAWCYYLICCIVQKKVRKNKKLITIIVLTIGSLCVLLAVDTVLQYVNSILKREAYKLADSSRTRNYVFSIILDGLKGNLKSWFVGSGAGYVEITIKKVMDIDYYMPVHQDFLLLLAEFGIIGLLCLYYIFLKKHYARWVFLYMFLICSFHNVWLATRTMLLMCIVVAEIENKNYNLISGSRRRVEKNDDIIYCKYI